MVQILPNARPSFSERLNAGVGRGLEIGQELIGQQQQRKQQKAEDDAVEQLTGLKVGAIRDPKLRHTVVEQALKGKSPQHEKIVDYLVGQGLPQDEAEFYSYLTTGGQTAVVKDLLESKKRGGNRPAKGLFSEDQDEQLTGENAKEEVPGETRAQPKQEVNPEKRIQKDLQRHIEDQDEGLTPSEKVARGKERYTTGLPKYEEASTRLRGLTGDKHRFEILESLEKTKKLPEGLGRINVDLETGGLKLAAAGSPEAQRYIKTLNEFSASAKDTFGSRVTNFDLAQYMQRYPTLLNSAEGRRQILQQMKVVNQINSVYYKNLKSVYDKAGGARNIDSDVADRFAEEISTPQIEKLAEKFNSIGKFESLPNPTEFKGKKIKNSDTGEIMVSDGKNWVPAGE